MMLPHPDHLPADMRAIGRRLLPTGTRQMLVHKIMRLYQLQHRFNRRYQDNARAIRCLKNHHAGQTCVIVGNGPSVRGFDLERLKGTTTFCLNRGYLLWQSQNRSPDYLVAVNQLVVEQFHAEISGVHCTHFIPWHYRTLISHNPRTFYLTERWENCFCEDLTAGIWFGGTVTFAALQIAFYLGFSKAILIGIDHSFRFHGIPNQELISAGVDSNHFDPNYFGPGTRWHAPDLERSELAYALAREAFSSDNRRILDATQGGQCPIFEKMSLEDALAA